MNKAIGRFFSKVWNNLHEAAKVVMGIPKNSRNVKVRRYVDDDGNIVFEQVEEVNPFEDAVTDWGALKLVAVVVVAAGIFFTTWPVSPELSPIMAALGGVLVKTATSLWREEWTQNI